MVCIELNVKTRFGNTNFPYFLRGTIHFIASPLLIQVKSQPSTPNDPTLRDDLVRNKNRIRIDIIPTRNTDFLRTSAIDPRIQLDRGRARVAQPVEKVDGRRDGRDAVAITDGARGGVECVGLLADERRSDAPCVGDAGQREEEGECRENCRADGVGWEDST